MGAENLCAGAHVIALQEYIAAGESGTPSEEAETGDNIYSGEPTPGSRISSTVSGEDSGT